MQRVLAVDQDYVGSIPALALSLFPTSYHWLVYVRLATAALVGLWQARSVFLGRERLAKAALEVVFTTILLATHFAGWYLALPLALSAMGNDRRTQWRMAIFTFTASLTTPMWAYLWWWTQDVVNETTFHLIVVPLTFVPPLVIAMGHGARFGTSCEIRLGLDTVLRTPGDPVPSHIES